jgi:hypothetical protein
MVAHMEQTVVVFATWKHSLVFSHITKEEAEQVEDALICDLADSVLNNPVGCIFSTFFILPFWIAQVGMLANGVLDVTTGECVVTAGKPKHATFVNVPAGPVGHKSGVVVRSEVKGAHGVLVLIVDW